MGLALGAGVLLVGVLETVVFATFMGLTAVFSVSLGDFFAGVVEPADLGLGSEGLAVLTWDRVLVCVFISERGGEW